MAEDELRLARRRRCRSTTSTAATSTSPAGSPSWSTGWQPRSTTLTGEHPLDEWLAALGTRDRPGSPTSPTTRRLAARPRPARARRRRSGCRRRAPTTALPLADVRALLADRLRGRPTRANFRTGDLTVCTLVPMRSVPHRVVCLLGLDDGVFPRHARAPTATTCSPATRCVGERDPRSEDRQLLLDAILAAERAPGRHLHRRRRAHQRRAPAGGPLGELLDVLDAHGPHADGAGPRARRRPTTRCSRSTRATSTPARSAPAGRSASTAVALAGARAAAAATRGAGPFLAAPLAPPATRRSSSSTT